MFPSFLILFFSLVRAEPVTYINQYHISPICSSARTSNDGLALSLPNAHLVLEKNNKGFPIYRSNSPYLSRHILELMDLNIGKVIVFKSFHKNSEKNQLYQLYRDTGYSESNLVHIPMPWRQEGKEPFDFKQACEFTVEAFNTLMESDQPSLFHCTVGEDRTGMLAGLLKVSVNGYSVQQAFQDEMCSRGYEAGNPGKANSPKVVNSIRDALTPLFLKLVTLLKSGQSLTNEVCSDLPTNYIDGLRSTDLNCDSVTEAFICPIERPVLDKVLSEDLSSGFDVEDY